MGINAINFLCFAFIRLVNFTAPLSDAVGPKFSPRSRRVWSVLAPRSAMLLTALRSGQFPSPRQRGLYAVAFFSSA